MVPLRFLRALYCVDGSLHPLHGGAAASARGCPSTAPARRRFPQRQPGPVRTPTGFADHPYPQGRIAAERGRRPTSPTSPTSPPCPSSRARSIGLHAGVRIEPSLPDLLDRVRLPDQPAGADRRTRPTQSSAAYYMNWAEYLVVAQSPHRLLRPVPADGSTPRRRCTLRRLRDRPAVRQRDAEGHAAPPTACRSTCRLTSGSHGPEPRGLGRRPPLPRTHGGPTGAR